MTLWPLEEAESWFLEQPSLVLSFPFNLLTWKISNLCKGEQHNNPPTPPPRTHCSASTISDSGPILSLLCLSSLTFLIIYF